MESTQHTRPSLGANLSVKNEEHRILRQHLENLKQFCDEIVVTVDEESTDNTFAICKEYTDKVFYIKSGDYSDYIRRAGSEKLSTDWELWVDADFLFPEATRNEIRQVIQQAEASCCELPLVNYYFGKWFTYPRHWEHHIRLFDRSKVTYSRNDLHEWEFSYPSSPQRLKNPFLHYGHPSIEGFIQQLNRYSSIDIPAIEAAGKGGLFQRSFGEIKEKDLVRDPLQYFDFYYNNLDFRKEGMFGAIYAWVFSFYAFAEKAKIVEHRYKQESRWQEGVIDIEQAYRLIREEGFEHHSAPVLSNSRFYKVKKIVRGLTPPYLAVLLKRTFLKAFYP
jgi:hypothetical protein